jgi:hypothetical protein
MSDSSRRNLAWKLNWYRHSELEGSLLLGRMVRQADDPQLVLSLTRHCADEARHAWLWARAIDELELPTVQIFRSYQSFYVREGASPPGTLAQVLAMTHIFERRVDREFRRELRSPDLPEAAARTFRALIADEQDHLDWVGRWLAERADGEALLARYRRIDEQVYREIEPMLDRVYDIPGLGRELLTNLANFTKETSYVAN